MRREWIEGIIVGICIVLTVELLHYQITGMSLAVRLLALLAAGVAVGLVQYIVSRWGKPKR